MTGSLISRFSMKSADHLKMPELVNSRYMVHLDEPELEKYERIEAEPSFTAAGRGSDGRERGGFVREVVPDGKRGGGILMTALMKRSMTGKLDALEDIIEAANGKPFLRPIGTSMT